jgi:hypothetical protein
MIRRAIAAVFLTAVWLPNGPAQTSATGSIVGAVSEASGGIVSGAAIEVVDPASGQTRSARSNEAGEYTIPNLPPGVYKVTASVPGFRQSVVPGLNVEVAKSYTLNFTLQVGDRSDTVEVKDTTAAELQTQDAAVGMVITGQSLLRMPAINRSSLTFFQLQPMVVPTRGITTLSAGQHLAGQVAGARADQTTFTVDGIDATDLTAGTNFYARAATDVNGPDPMIPVPAESVEEFRLTTTNANATYREAAGGQLSLLTKRGTNDLHGTAYYYLQNNIMNANRWDYNRTGIRRPALHDNRFGGALGGAVCKDKTFFFVNYEGRRLPQTTPVNRLVPTDSLRQGILRFVDGSGAVRSYNVAGFDPRGLGLSPVVRSFWNHMPAGNNAGAGDGLNTTGFLAPIDAAIDSNVTVGRVDHIFSERWRLSASYRYASQGANGTSQVDIAGFAPGDTIGKGAPGGRTDDQPRTLGVRLSTIVSPSMVNDLTLGDARNFWADQRTPPAPQVPGTAGALSVASNFLDQGIDVSAGTARSRVWDNQNYQLRDNYSWVKANHYLSFGGGWQHIRAFHQRDDKIVGTQLTQLVYNLNARTGISIPASARPPTCSGTVTTNCLQSASVATWNDLFAGALGMVDSGGVIAVRDSSLNPAPAYTPIRLRANWENLDFYGNDAWRVTPSLTVTLGLNWTIQTPPTGPDARQAVPVDQSTGKLLTARYVFTNRSQAANQGQVWNPPLTWTEVGKSGGPSSVYSTDWKTAGPRIAASWSPQFQTGPLGAIFGNRRTAVRAGFSIVFDRINGSTNMFFPPLSVAFAQTLTCIGPRRDGTCRAGADPTTAFRLGVDGSAIGLSDQLPGNDLTPASGLSETTSFALDPTLHPGLARVVDFTVQRELGRGFVIEMGYTGHFGQELLQSVDLNAVPYFMRDSASGQTFAQAYDAVANYLRAGSTAATVPAQPWFENQLRGAALCATSCTAGLAASQNSALTQGLLNTLFNVINAQRSAGPITNYQVSSLWMRTNGGTSVYNAGFLSLQRRFANGLAMQANYTLSRATDQHGYNQEAESVIANGFNFRLDNAPAAFDRTHVFNTNFFYELPLGAGKRWHTSKPLNWLAGGWYLAGIFTAHSGAPLTLQQSTSAFGGGPQIGTIPSGAIPLGPIPSSSGVNSNVAGSGGVGTAGNPATGGSGLNLFADPAAVFHDFRPIELSLDGRSGRNTLRGLGHWNLDASLGKKARINERVSAVLTGDFINLLNHVEFVDPTLSLQSASSFGVLTTQYGTARAVQVSLRIEF